MDLERSAGSNLPEARDWSETRNLLVLVIDSNVDSLGLTTQVLNLCGCSLISTARGLEALQFLQEKQSLQERQPDLILTELILDDIDGIELVKQLRGSAIATPIIAVTTLWLSPYQELAMSAGCDGFVKKPYEIEDLVAIAANYLPLPFSPF
jgi:two-component system cell cycle response regulator DivK